MKLKFTTAVLLLTLLALVACRREQATPETEPAVVEQETATGAITTSAAESVPASSPAPTHSETAVPESDEEALPEPGSGSDLPPAPIVNDEGGPVAITGVVTYTNPFFTLGVAEPVVILEDQAGFVDRNRSFLMPVASQTLGQITSDFYTSPFSYSISLPIEPQGTLRDVDNDETAELGVQVFAVAYWTNTFGDPFLEERDLSGGGWSTAYASTRVSDDADTEWEVVGGKLLVFAPDDGQGFPAAFGDDGLLFTGDDPIVGLPQGYTVVNLDVDPFTFDRGRHQVINLVEPESIALVDFSELGYAEAFDALVDKLSREYAFTEYKNIDWDALHQEFRPRFEEAEAGNDALAYRRALRDFSWSIPDGHVSGPQVAEDFRENVSGGLGLAIRETDDGRVIANYLLPGGPAGEAGIELGAQIITLNSRDVDQTVSETVAYSAPFSSEHVKRLEQLNYATRFPVGSSVDISWRNPGSDSTGAATLTAVAEQESFNFSSLNAGLDGFEQPLEYEQLNEGGYGYVKIYSFSDNELLTVQLWERLMGELKDNNVPGLIIDMRQNLGGSGFLADQMAAYFFDEPLELGNTGYYDDDRGDFYFDPRGMDRFYLPAEELRYMGEVVVIAGPNCNSACEFFTYAMTLEDRAAVVGFYPTAGLGGSIDRVLMPEGEYFTFTQGRAVDANGEIHIEGKGVPPDIDVPVTSQTLLGGGDALLTAAIAHLDEVFLGPVVNEGEINLGSVVEGTLETASRVRYVLSLAEGDVLSIRVDSRDFSPILSLYDESGNLLGNTAGRPEATVDGLDVPFDLVLLIEVSAGDGRGGDYTITVGDDVP